MLGSIFLHLAVESSFPQSRRSSLATVERLAASLPEHTNLAILSACAAYLSREEKVVPTKTNATGDDAQESSASKASREARLPATGVMTRRRGCCGNRHSLFGNPAPRRRVRRPPPSRSRSKMARKASARASTRSETPPVTKDDLSTRESLILAQAVFELGVHEWHKVVQILNGHSLIQRPETAFTPESTEAIWRAMMTDAGVELYVHLS